ncbi:hypothetical protein, partial [Persephonella sp.]
RSPICSAKVFNSILKLLLTFLLLIFSLSYGKLTKIASLLRKNGKLNAKRVFTASAVLSVSHC